jgi:hypothetical protein
LINYCRKFDGYQIKDENDFVVSNQEKEEALKQEWAMQKALTENKLQMKMDVKGKILSITGFDPVYAKITKTLSGLTKDQKNHQWDERKHEKFFQRKKH